MAKVYNLNANDQKLLLNLARNALISSFNDSDPDVSKVGHLTQLRGCFVTLHKNNKLRGCIGFPKPILPLYEQIIAATKAAAFDDPRFDPLTKEELKNVIIEISILTKPELIKVKNPDEYLTSIIIGKDGLIIKGKSSGLLLPQVATEYNFDVKQFLECLCEKANLDKDSWKNSENKIYKFHAEIFSEDNQ
ncbi:MAG: AmmeMemoRadiSam system protein A [Candidatus Woesearchaeota archaeon]